MKNRLISYFILLPIILLIALTNIDVYLEYVAWATIPLSIGLIIYALIKTKAFYKMKKALILLVLALSLLAPLTSYAQGHSEYYNVRRELEEISRIPRDQRTVEEQKKYIDARKKLATLNKSFNVPAACPTPKELQVELSSNCWACDIANLFIEAADKVAYNFYKFERTNGLAKTLLALGFFCWILVHVLKLFMSFGRGDIGAFFTDFFTKCLLVGGIFILLGTPMQNLVNFAISPFFLLSSTVTQEIGKTAEPANIDQSLAAINGISAEGRAEIKSNITSMLRNGMECRYCKDAVSNEQKAPAQNISNAINYHVPVNERVISSTMRNSLLCTICNIYNTTVQPTVTGQFMLCNVKHKKKNIAIKEVYSDFEAWVIALLLIVTFFVVSALFSFYLIDTFFRIAIVLVLLPFLVVAAAFKSTLVYTKRGMEVLIHSVLTYILIGLFMAITVQIFYYIIGDQMINIIKATGDGNYQQLRSLVHFSNEGGLIVLACFGLMMIVFFMLREVDSYIATISGIKLGNEGGYQAFRSATTAMMVAPRTISEIYSADWRRASNHTGNSAEDKAERIRRYGADTSTPRIDRAINNAGQAGRNATRGLMNSGAQMCRRAFGLGTVLGVPMMLIGAMGYGTTAAAESVVRHTTHAVVRPIIYAMPHKIIARNKYFNKTVGGLWQIGADARADYRNSRAAAIRYYRRARGIIRRIIH